MSLSRRTTCRYPDGPRVTSLVAIRNQPRFLKLQKEWDKEGGGRKGGCKRSKAEKVAEKVVATGIVGKANPEGLGVFLGV